MRRILPLLLLAACQEYDLKSTQDPVGEEDDDTVGEVFDLPPTCELKEVRADGVGRGDICNPVQAPPGGFEPIVEWTGGPNQSCSSQPAVADLDGDGQPEIIANFTGGLGVGGHGDLVVLEGDGSGVRWRDNNAKLGYGSGPTVADILGSRKPEILVVQRLGGSAFSIPQFKDAAYHVVAYSHTGHVIWTSDPFGYRDFDYASAISVSDMDHDGNPEIVVGRVILRADGTTRGVGAYGRGSYGGLEASVSAVSDLDRNGIEEVITGNAIYDPDGNALWNNPNMSDGMISIANLDDDPAGEFIAVSGNNIRAMDLSGAILWGPDTIQSANIVSPAAIGDIDVDGDPDVIVAGGNKLWALDGKTGNRLWQHPVTDQSGATGASIFDFEGDGFPEVVYIDEVEMIAFDGRTGDVKFHSDKHSSATMFDYPVIADVDGDNHAEIVVCHMTFGVALTVYGDKTNSWVPARKVWNQHAYSISNIHDDLSVPRNEPPGFEVHNSWHAGIGAGTVNASEDDDLESEIIEICDSECNEDVVLVVGRVLNRGANKVPSGIPVSLYSRIDGADTLLETKTTKDAIKPGKGGEPLVFEVETALVKDSDGLLLSADDDGTWRNKIEECAEFNNEYLEEGPFCRN